MKSIFNKSIFNTGFTIAALAFIFISTSRCFAQAGGTRPKKRSICVELAHPAVNPNLTFLPEQESTQGAHGSVFTFQKVRTPKGQEGWLDPIQKLAWFGMTPNAADLEFIQSQCTHSGNGFRLATYAETQQLAAYMGATLSTVQGEVKFNSEGFRPQLFLKPELNRGETLKLWTPHGNPLHDNFAFNASVGEFLVGKIHFDSFAGLCVKDLTQE